MNLSTIIFSIIIIILLIIIIFLYIKINNINKTLINHILKDINPNVSKEISDIKQLTLDKLKVKDIEVENSLISPNINTDNLNSIIDKININNDIYVNNDVNVNPKAGIKVKLDLGDGFNKPYIGNKDKSFELKNITTDYKISFDDMIMRDLTYLFHVDNNKLHNGNSTDQFITYINNSENQTKKSKSSNFLKEENNIENFTDLFYL